MTRLVLSAFAIAVGVLAFQSANGQSTLADFPTPVSTNELSGTIKARDLGDPRLTTYYYWFEGSQGDVFVNLVTKNFAGDVDVFLQNGLRSLTKIVVLPDFGETETGRVIYLRKPEKLLLRVHGRTPNEEPAQFRVKFAGSFVAVTGNTELEMPKVSGDTVGSVRVNSVGTIIPPPPKPVKDETETPVAVVDTAQKEVETKEKPKSETETETSETKSVPKVEVVVTDDLKESIAKAPARRTTPPRRTRNTRATPPKKVVAPPATEISETAEKKDSEVETPPETATVGKTAKTNPLENVQLVIVFKDGRKIERPLLDVASFRVDRGILTVVAKGGRIGRYSMVDVAKVTIE
jgi:hypothetical protein